MPISAVSICNRALQMLGADSIINLSEDSNKARALNIAYEPVRDAELHRRRWRFAIKRASIPASAVAPDSDFNRQFPVPNDFLRLVPGGDIRQLADMSDFRSGTSQMYSIEGGMILTDLPAPLAIRYIYRVTDPALFNPSFAEALSARLAHTCCERITQSDSKQQLAWGYYKQAIREAVVANAIEGAPESQADDTWVMARLG
jgi:hypothetical protein